MGISYEKGREAMYEVGEYIVHPGQGVCKVDEVRDVPQPAYMLMPVGVRNPMRISYPVAGESRLRPVLSSDEAERIIDEYPTLELIDYTDRSAALEEEHFRGELRKGSCRDNVRIVKTFRHRIAEVQARNKRPPVAYERILKQASQRSLQELAVALAVTTDEVRDRFAEQDESFDAVG